MELPGEEPETHAPGFEPPTDVDVPWYAWLLWPLAAVVALVAGSLLFRSCMSWM